MAFLVVVVQIGLEREKGGVIELFSLRRIGPGFVARHGAPVVWGPHAVLAFSVSPVLPHLPAFLFRCQWRWNRDIGGVIQKLDYLKDLGYETIWIFFHHFTSELSRETEFPKITDITA
jgi:hypothetical protein